MCNIMIFINLLSLKQQFEFLLKSVPFAAAPEVPAEDDDAAVEAIVAATAAFLPSLTSSV